MHQHISLRHKLLRGKAAVTASQRLCMDSRGYTVLGDKPLGWMKSVLDHFAPRHLRSFVIPLFFWQPFQQFPSSLPHCQREQRQLKCLEAPALLRASVITISFLITASIQIRDSNQFSHGIGLGMGRWKKGIFLTLQLSYIFQWLYPSPPPRGKFCPASCRSDCVC